MFDGISPTQQRSAARGQNQAMITVVGAGFAGVEAAWAIAQRGGRVRLFEMRPHKMTPAHETGWFAELVCSNSFKSKLPTSPAGQLKAEMEALGSLVIEVARRNEVPGGAALAVDREKFGKEITRLVDEHPLIEVVLEEWLPEMHDGSPLILATGPLSSDPVSEWLAELTGRTHLYFYDAVSPTVEASSLDFDVVFAQSRYDKGEGDDYLNCPFDKESYDAFIQALVSAERVPVHAFEAGGKRDGPPGKACSTPEPEDEGGGKREQVSRTPKEEDQASLEEAFVEKIKYFAGCMPIEVIAERGHDSLRFGNFKPVGLTDPRTDRRPYAALQLRPENREKTLFSLVACQTRLRWGEQKRVFQMVPGLEKAEFVRYGVIHRNTYIEAPRTLNPFLELQEHPGIYVAGQLTGVEGYVESAAMGIYAGIQALRKLEGQEQVVPARACAYGSLLAHLQDSTPREFAPMNINWGLFPDPEPHIRDKRRRQETKLEAAQQAFHHWLTDLAQ
jgi:methylenetetrahydrofolate--tRNA-(uracil-5-)-methyltransferase